MVLLPSRPRPQRGSPQRLEQRHLPTGETSYICMVPPHAQVSRNEAARSVLEVTVTVSFLSKVSLL